MDPNINSLTFEAKVQEGTSSFSSFKLIIKPNYEFSLSLNESKTSPNEIMYEGKFISFCFKDYYFLDFSNIQKSYTTIKQNGKGKGKQQIHREDYTQELSAEIKPNGTCELKGEWKINMNIHTIKNSKQFFNHNYPNMTYINDIEMEIYLCKSRKNICCRSKGPFIDCGVPCKGDCCGYLGKLCSDPCENSKKINDELSELYKQQMENLLDDDLYSRLNFLISVEKFEKIIINRLNHFIKSFSNCIHNWNGYSWVKCCQFCKIENVYNYVCKNYSEAENNFKICFAKKYFKTNNSNNFMVCDKCPYQICVFCNGIYEINILKKPSPLHKHDLLLKTEEHYSSTCDLCNEKIDRPWRRCDICYFNVCCVCYANYEAMYSSFAD